MITAYVAAETSTAVRGQRSTASPGSTSVGGPPLTPAFSITRATGGGTYGGSVRRSSSTTGTALWLGLAGLVQVGALVATYVVFVRTRTGQLMDAAALFGTGYGRARVDTLLEQVLGVVSVTSLLVVTVVIAGIALARRRPWLAAGRWRSWCWPMGRPSCSRTTLLTRPDIDRYPAGPADQQPAKRARHGRDVAGGGADPGRRAEVAGDRRGRRSALRRGDRGRHPLRRLAPPERLGGVVPRRRALRDRGRLGAARRSGSMPIVRRRSRSRRGCWR